MRRGMVWGAVALAAAAAQAQAQVNQGNANAPPNAPQQGPAPQGVPQQPAPQQNAAAQPAPQQNAPAPSLQAAAPQPQQAGQAPTGATSDAFDRACIDMLHGQMPPDERAIRTLKDACASLMSGRADERLDAERRRREQLAAQEQLRRIAAGDAQVQPGQSTAQPQQGQGVLAAFGEAGRELTGAAPRGAMGMTRRGPVGYMLVTNPIGWFSGLGANAELFGAFEDAPKFSWVAGARYSVTDATNGTASTFGAEGGLDFFIIGRNNEGFRIGPRVELAAGRERFQSENTFARLGMGGEVGYNFIASSGISGMLALGLGGRVAGDNKNDSFASFVGGEFGPYAKLGVGFAW